MTLGLALYPQPLLRMVDFGGEGGEPENRW